MSTRERAAIIFDSLTEQQLEEFIDYFGNYEQNEKDYENYVWEKLHEADILAKETSERMTHEEVFGQLRNRLNYENCVWEKLHEADILAKEDPKRYSLDEAFEIVRRSLSE